MQFQDNYKSSEKISIEIETATVSIVNSQIKS